MSFSKKLLAAFGLAAIAQTGLLMANIQKIDRDMNNELEKLPHQIGSFAAIGGNAPFIRYNRYDFNGNHDQACLRRIDANILFGQAFNKKITAECKSVSEWKQTGYAKYFSLMP